MTERPFKTWSFTAILPGGGKQGRYFVRAQSQKRAAELCRLLSLPISLNFLRTHAGESDTANMRGEPMEEGVWLSRQDPGGNFEDAIRTPFRLYPHEKRSLLKIRAARN